MPSLFKSCSVFRSSAYWHRTIPSQPFIHLSPPQRLQFSPSHNSIADLHSYPLQPTRHSASQPPPARPGRAPPQRSGRSTPPSTSSKAMETRSPVKTPSSHCTTTAFTARAKAPPLPVAAALSFHRLCRVLPLPWRLRHRLCAAALRFCRRRVLGPWADVRLATVVWALRRPADRATSPLHRGTKETFNSCLVYRHAISLVANLLRRH